MSFRQVSLRSPVPLPDWLPNFIILPSVLSVLAHTFLLVVFAVTLRSCERAPVGFSDEPTRAFGIVVTQPGDRVESAKTDDSTDSNDANSESSTDATTSVSQQSTPLVADAPPAELLLPKAESTPAIGSSVSFPNGESSANSSLSLKQGSGSDEKSNGKQGGPPGTVFMG
ncbi:MAG: hypothetical protein FJ267_09240, partial [Planctomycetes bacterium]|nr:hypothetical protein [Planctomycetota bacterium]